jgi:glycosyltransferase involved in cell wall biosynthesis
MNQPAVKGNGIDSPCRILIVSEHASTKFGGEACLPWHYFCFLRRRGIETWLVVHARTKDELLASRPEDADRIYFVPDTLFDKLASRIGRYLPGQIAFITVGYASRLKAQWAARRLARRLIAEKRVDVVHQPIPVSPREPSLMYGLGVPVVIGPMNGNMSYPLAFCRRNGKFAAINIVNDLARFATRPLNWLIPGKPRAAVLLAANDRTQRALKEVSRAEIITLIENSVDLRIWTPTTRDPNIGGPARFVFMGRLVDWKAVDLLLEAFARVEVLPLPQLEIIGDGKKRAELEAQAIRLGVSDRVFFVGWHSQIECAKRLREADALVLPSLYECGGAVVLEAMACGIAVIATKWGGPTDYLDASCGILVAPDSRESMISGFADAMSRLAANPTLRAEFGRVGRERVVKEFDWERKIDQILMIYREATLTARKRGTQQKSTYAERRL